MKTFDGRVGVCVVGVGVFELPYESFVFLVGVFDAGVGVFDVGFECLRLTNQLGNVTVFSLA